MFEGNKEIVLELGNTAQAPAVPATKEEEVTYLPEVELSEAEQKMVNDFSEKIDLNDSAIVLQYGTACQKKVADFSNNALEGVRTKDLGATCDMITDLVTELKGFSVDEEDDNGFFGLFKKAGNKVSRLKAKYDRAEVNVDKITAELEVQISIPPKN